jgi:putative adenylate-forming enzyme
MIGDVLPFLMTFIRHRWGYRFKSRQQLLEYQMRRIARHRRRLAKTAFYGPRRDTPIADLPIVAKRDVLASFEQFNVYGIPLEAARAHALAAECSRDFAPTLKGGISVGLSSGTSGQPSLFLVSRRERMLWAGAVLGRMLSPASLRRVVDPFSAPLRIAFFLRANSNLYTSLRSVRVKFVFFDLAQSMVDHLQSLSTFRPDILVAPASVLAHLADCQRMGTVRIAPHQIISVAERLEADDARDISLTWRTTVQQIYQCTEGFLGYTCTHGSIHLNEECVYFEQQWQDDSKRRFTAVLTDFRRRTQMFVRYQMDDVLLVHPEPCACGRVTLRLESIEGRQDEILWLPRLGSDALAPVFPDQVRRALMLGAPTCGDYRLEQRGLRLTLAVRDQIAHPETYAQFERALKDLWETLEVRAPILCRVDWAPAAPCEKRRRIRCLARPLLDLEPSSDQEKLLIAATP